MQATSGSTLVQRHVVMHNGVQVNVPIMGDSTAPSSSTPLLPQTRQVEAAPNLPVRRIVIPGTPGTDITEVGSLFNKVPEQVAVENAGMMNALKWAHPILGLVYIAAAIVLFIIILTAPSRLKINSYWSPESFNTITSSWVVSLVSTGLIYVHWVFIVLLGALGVYHLAHFPKPIRNLYETMVFVWYYNAIRWVAHAVAGGLAVGFLSMVVGVSDIVVVTNIILAFAAACIFMLVMEQINPPPVYGDDGKISQDKGVNWIPYLAGAVMLILVVGQYMAYFFYTVNQAVHKNTHVPWYSWFVALDVCLVLAVIGVVNGLAYFVSWNMLKYKYIEIIHIVAEIFIALGMCIAIIGASA